MRKIVDFTGSIGDRRLRLCPVQNKKVVCHGICKAVFADHSGIESAVQICPVYEKSLDLALNC